tara:strand:+ start:431 stop:736 length:306 start_codon:yes stop_codon:yes gene_type:complete
MEIKNQAMLNASNHLAALKYLAHELHLEANRLDEKLHTIHGPQTPNVGVMSGRFAALERQARHVAERANHARRVAEKASLAERPERIPLASRNYKRSISKF